MKLNSEISQFSFESENFISLPIIDYTNTTKEEIKASIINSHNLYEYLFSSFVSEESFLDIPDPLRRNMIFYYGHPMALYMNKLKMMGLTTSINENCEKMFATGVDPTCREELDPENYKPIWPKSQEVKEFRELVLNRVLELIDSQEFTLPIQKSSFFWCMLLGIEHERIHFETSTVLIRQMKTKFVKKPTNWKYAPYDQINFPKNDLISLESQEIQYGKPHEFPCYGWDNEFGQINSYIKNVKINKFKITNGEYLEFINDGGYDDDTNWETEGLKWRNLESTHYPRFWIKNSDAKCGFDYRAIFDILPMPMNWPVDVIYHEAQAYCTWKGKKDNTEFRIIKESEFNVIRANDLVLHNKRITSKNTPKTDFPASSNKEDNFGNFKLRFGSSSPVDFFPPSPLGFYDTVGNSFEWTVDKFKPLPGFKFDDLYKDFSIPCFDPYHNLLMGSSWASQGQVCSIFQRTAFRRHFYQNCGFRMVEEIKEKVDENNMYETRKIVSEYIATFYYQNVLKENIFDGLPTDIALDYKKDFGVKVAEFATEYYKQVNKVTDEDIIKQNLSALDLGCGVGKTSFHLTKLFKDVTGLDFSRCFINVCDKIKNDKEIDFEYLMQGNNYIKAKAHLDKEYNPDRVNFMVGDAMNLPTSTNFGPFDLLILANLIDRLPNPKETLTNLMGMMKPNAVVVITSPYTWMECFAPKKNWIGGNDEKPTFEALKDLMKTLCFEFVGEKTVALYIREHERKYQLCCPQMTAWKKTDCNEEFATSIFKK